jgi:hypothetical protein
MEVWGLHQKGADMFDSSCETITDFNAAEGDTMI